MIYLEDKALCLSPESFIGSWLRLCEEMNNG